MYIYCWRPARCQFQSSVRDTETGNHEKKIMSAILLWLSTMSFFFGPTVPTHPRPSEDRRIQGNSRKLSGHARLCVGLHARVKKYGLH